MLLLRLSCFVYLSSICLAWTQTPRRRRLGSKIPRQAQGCANHHHEESSPSNRRRDLLLDTTLVTASTIVLGMLPVPALAAAPTTTAEAIRRSATNIPGYGPTDIFFPASWLGQWRVQRQVRFGDNPDDTATLNYTTRFIPSIEDEAVVLDRGFAQANLEAAAAKATTPPSYQWAFTNPNDLRLSWPDGRRKDIKVTQRATDYQQVAQGRLWSSEVQRVTNDGGGNGVPAVTARRVVTQYRWEFSDRETEPTSPPPRLVQALEVIYDLGGSDPMRSRSDAGNNVILTKSRVVMQQVEFNK